MTLQTDRIAVVFGASGFVGRYVVRALTRSGWRVRAVTRRPFQSAHLQVAGLPGQVEIVKGNIRSEASIEMAVSGADAVVNLVGILAEGGQQTFDALQSRGAGAVARIAAEHGIERMVHVSAIGADGRSSSAYARTKAEGEDAVAEALPGAVILRPSIVFGIEDDFFNRFATMARFSPALPLIGGGKTRFQPVYVGDVADAVVAGLNEPKHRGRTFELGGPEVLSFKALMELMLRLIGRRRALVPLPFFAASMMGKAGATAGKLPFVTPPLTDDQVELLRRDNVVGLGQEAVGTLADLGVEPHTLDAVLPTYLYRYRKQGQFSPEVPI